jgi:hypothetical protein
LSTGFIYFYLLHNDQTGFGAHPTSCSVGAGIVGLKQPGCKVNHSSPPGAEVQINEAPPVLLLYLFVVWTWKNKCDPEPILKLCHSRHVYIVPSDEVVLCNETD